AEARLEGIRGLVDVVPVEAVAHLETQRVARAEADGPNSFRRSRLEDAVPEPERPRRPHVDLEAVLAGVAGAGNHRPVVADSLLEGFVEREGGRTISIELGDHGFGPRTLDGELRRHGILVQNRDVRGSVLADPGEILREV